MLCKLILYEICGFHNNVDEDSIFLGYDAMAMILQ